MSQFASAHGARCKYCDYSEEAPSLYREGLMIPKSHVRVTIDTKTGDPVCSSCTSEINSDLLDKDEDQSWVGFLGSVNEHTNKI